MPLNLWRMVLMMSLIHLWTLNLLSWLSLTKLNPSNLLEEL